MIYRVEVAADVEELRAAYPVVADESMRCAPPAINLHPDDADAYHAVQNQSGYVARDDLGTIHGMAIINPEGHVSWLTLPAEDSLNVMEALLDHFKDAFGVSPWGDIATPTFREHVLTHPKMTMRDDAGVTVIWRRDG